MSHITAVIRHIMRVDKIQIQMEKFSWRKQSHVIWELMAIEEELSSEEQTYYTHSMNTMHVVEGERPVSESDKLCFNVQVC